MPQPVGDNGFFEDAEAEEETSPRPDTINTETHGVVCGCGNIYITTTINPHDSFEIWFHLGKSGGCPQAYLEILGKCLTRMRRTRHPIARKDILQDLDGIRCPMDSIAIPSCPQAIADTLRLIWGMGD